MTKDDVGRSLSNCYVDGQATTKTQILAISTVADNPLDNGANSVKRFFRAHNKTRIE